MSSHLPQEICDEIMRHLRGDDNALKACSLACRPFLPSCQRFLFSNIVVFPPTDKKKRPNGHHLQRLLKASPHLCRYVHYLEIIDCHPEEEEWLSLDRTLIFCLPLLCRLKALAVQYRTPMERGDWEGIAQGGLLDALLDIMQLPSLTYLHFDCLPLGIVNHCPNLKHFALRCATTNSVMGYSCMQNSSAQSVYLDSLKVDFLHPVILDHPMNSISISRDWFSDTINNTALNVTKLKKLHASAIGELREHHDMWMLLKLCASSLEEFAFNPATDTNKPEASSMDPIDWSILTNLKRFYTRIEVSYDYDDDDEVILDAFPCQL
ncbi:hypothetical protein BDZ97DRAFT_213001 [Flammula alnicola]|nr:hypothetical protein BDZ97DRAFT_213001 [Flammula alnicola]